jgi:hypothetical protein
MGDIALIRGPIAAGSWPILACRLSDLLLSKLIEKAAVTQGKIV